MEIISRFTGEEAIRAIDVDKLNQVIKAHQKSCRKDRNISVKYRNLLRRSYARPGVIYEEEEEQELYPDWQVSNTDMIRDQNEEYKKVKEEAMKRERELLQEKRRQEEVEEERKARKMSIPDEPTEGEMVRINFRCPDGSTVIRNFSSNERLEMIYAWVETNEQIEFEDNSKRQFELLYSFPPTALCQRKEEELKEIFDSDQEKVMIREL